MGFVFQSYNLLTLLTALDNVELPLAIAGVKRRISVPQAEHVLTLVGLSGRIKHRPSELSGGEQQRVALARALVNAPAIVFADEPTGNLDTKTGSEIVQLMHQLNRDQGVTFLIATHDSRIANASDRVVRLEDGSIKAQHVKQEG
jgi:putative ABC transport system ATP-binding protein